MKRHWPALILAPLFALAGQVLAYALVTPACERSHVWFLHASMLLFFALAAVSTVGAFLSFRDAERGEAMPLISTWSGAFFSVVILVQWLAIVVLSPCMHSP
jgi:hypothetical protein